MILSSRLIRMVSIAVNGAERDELRKKRSGVAKGFILDGIQAIDGIRIR